MLGHDLEQEYELAEVRRKLTGMLTFGTVTAVSDDGRRVKASIPDLGKEVETDFMTVLCDDRTGLEVNKPFKLGERVSIFNPNGDFRTAMIIGTLKISKPSAPQNEPYMRFKDGTLVSYDEDRARLYVLLGEEARLELSGKGGSVSLGSDEIKIETKTKLEVKNKAGDDLISSLSELLKAMAPSASTPVQWSDDKGILSPAIQKKIYDTQKKLEKFKGGAMIGASHDNLKPVGYLEQKRQEVIDVLLTPRGSRIFHKEYGSNLFKLIDSPLTETRRFVAEVGESISRNVKDYKIKKVTVTQPKPGALSFQIVGSVPSLGRSLDVSVNYG